MSEKHPKLTKAGRPRKNKPGAGRPALEINEDLFAQYTFDGMSIEAMGWLLDCHGVLEHRLNPKHDNFDKNLYRIYRKKRSERSYRNKQEYDELAKQNPAAAIFRMKNEEGYRDTPIESVKHEAASEPKSPYVIIEKRDDTTADGSKENTSKLKAV